MTGANRLMLILLAPCYHKMGGTDVHRLNDWPELRFITDSQTISQGQKTPNPHSQAGFHASLLERHAPLGLFLVSGPGRRFTRGIWYALKTGGGYNHKSEGDEDWHLLLNRKSRVYREALLMACAVPNRIRLWAPPFFQDFNFHAQAHKMVI